MSSNSENNKKIVKNTLALYFRQVVTMVVSLFTSRVVLAQLGVADFGINNVVGGVVIMLSFLTDSLSGTTQRFLSVELGKNDLLNLKQVFANSLSLHIIFILLTVVLAETVGLWFLQTKLVIPPERAVAAFWVFQFSVISFLKNVFFAPFYGAIKAHEKFDFYAKMSIFDVIMKLVAAYMLLVLPYDKLVALAFMWLCVGIAGKIIVYIYCCLNFEECKIKLSWTKDWIRQLLGYNAYTVIGAISYIIRFQGLNIVLNLYYGPVMNAAQGIANTVNGAISSFSNNVMIATQPQIIMSYAKEDKQRLWTLITKTSKLNFYLFLILALPFIMEINTALYIWLGNYPQYAPVFAQLFLLEGLQRILGHPITIANMAVGKLRAVTIQSIIFRLVILLCAVFIGLYKLSPVYIYISALVLQGVSFSITVVIVLKMQLGFSIKKYFIDVILPISKTNLVVVSLPIVSHYVFSKSIVSSCGVGLFTLIWSMIIVFYIGLDKNEKQMVVNKLPPFLRKMIFFK
ncbi:MAG: hypothetical protein FWE72_01100 [Spirochaetaceae bacterium]|nr:hypothetical protein [Spirochaetaceae bacterium]